MYSNPIFGNYDNAEEKRVIDLENKYVNNYNKQFIYQLVVTGGDGTTYPIDNTGQKQGERKDHRGTLFTTNGVNPVEPKQ